MRPEASRSAALAARISDLDTETGQIRGLRPGFILCERSEQRRAMRPQSSRFVVRPWEQDQVRLIMRGLNPLVSGDAGPDNDGTPLFKLAAERYPERREEFEAEIERIAHNRQKRMQEGAIPPLTPAQQAERQAAIIAQGVRDGLGSAGVAQQQPAESSNDAIPKRSGPGPAPQPTKARGE